MKHTYRFGPAGIARAFHPPKQTLHPWRPSSRHSIPSSIIWTLLFFG